VSKSLVSLVLAKCDDPNQWDSSSWLKGGTRALVQLGGGGVGGENHSVGSRMQRVLPLRERCCDMSSELKFHI